MRICLAASSGGHLSQLLRVAPAWKGHDIFWVTTTEVVKEKLEKLGRVCVVGECNREHPLRVLCVLGRCLAILLRERPRAIVSTGAATGCLVCLVGKVLGCKVVWLDSITNVERPSLSGRLVRPFADLFLVQWPDLAEKYRGAEYVGAVV